MMPVAKASNIRIEDGKLKARAEFMPRRDIRLRRRRVPGDQGRLPVGDVGRLLADQVCVHRGSRAAASASTSSSRSCWNSRSCRCRPMPKRSSKRVPPESTSRRSANGPENPGATDGYFTRKPDAAARRRQASPGAVSRRVKIVRAWRASVRGGFQNAAGLKAAMDGARGSVGVPGIKSATAGGWNFFLPRRGRPLFAMTTNHRST